MLWNSIVLLKWKWRVQWVKSKSELRDFCIIFGMSNKQQKNIVREKSRSERLRIAAGESLLYVVFYTPSTKTQEIEFLLEGRGASVTIVGWDLHTHGLTSIQHRVIHKAPNTVSRTYVRSVLGGSAESMFHGLIHIDQKACGSDATFTHNTLLTSDQAHGRAEPTLEIETSDVAQVKHSATCASFDPEQLYYLTSRGLTDSAAQKLLIEGFAGELSQYLPSHVWRKLRLIMQQKLRFY